MEVDHLPSRKCYGGQNQVAYDDNALTCTSYLDILFIKRK